MLGLGCAEADICKGGKSKKQWAEEKRQRQWWERG